ncbi:hypothetical protein N180_03090 [Pedobacter antarcticus 4BY]|uniref:Uncharacterized protein n=2 Tax=Pedobacter antarcticus TaxID=34086 RepID=A0A081PKM4_9SPHI|nr:hypothetical protein [Pedobacter antarcticus]KEQ31247.1 hypothetical protein N180_03090 [Pedobacter antarcticus 4BY]SFE56268.1 hypothetical protein SAMN03003324_00903 [Pedobacter antarcticus]
MGKKEKEFEAKMKAILLEKQLIIKNINSQLERYRKLEAEEEQLEDDEFERTGIFSIELDFEINITERDMMIDLIKRSEGINFTPDKQMEN